MSNFQLSVLCLVITLGIYFANKRLYRRFRKLPLMPLVLTPALLVLMLVFGHISWQNYIGESHWLLWLLGPATIAFAVPVYDNLAVIKRHWMSLTAGVVTATLVAVTSSVWLARLSGRLRMDEDYLHKVDPDAPFKRELAALDQLIAQFDLAQAAKRGPDLLNRYPGRLPLLERLYAIASGRQDRALLSALLKQLFALPDSPERLLLLKRLADDSAADEQPLLRHAAVQLHLLPPLIRAGEGQRALACWRRLSQATPGPTQLPGLTLQLARLLGQGRDLRAIGELTRFLHSRYPEAEQTRQLALLQQHLAR